MKLKERLFAYGAIVLLLSVIVYFFYIEKPKYIEKYNNKIEALEIINDSILNRYKNLESTVDFYNSKIKFLDREIMDMDSSIYNLNREKNEKIFNIDSFSGNELQQFFTERYIDSNYKDRDSSRNN